MPIPTLEQQINLAPGTYGDYGSPHVSSGWDAINAFVAGDIQKALRLAPNPWMATRLQRMNEELTKTGTISDATIKWVGGLRDDLRQGRGYKYHYSPDTVDQLSGAMYNLSRGLKRTKQEGRLGGMMEGATVLPNVAGQVTGGTKKPADMSMEDYMRSQVYNAGLAYLDPESRAETARYLSTSAPGMYSQYEQTFADSPGAAQNARDAAQAAATRTANAAQAFNVPTIASQFDPNTRVAAILGPIGGTPESGKGMKDLTAGLSWMRRYLNQASSAMKPGATRADQLKAQSRLRTLESEAEQGPAAAYKTLAENITNPVTQRAQYQSIFDRRALRSPSGDYKRAGIARRNVGAL